MTHAPHDPRAYAVQAYRAARAHFPDFVPHATEVLQTIETLGRGGMGVVHRVLDARLERQAALKLLLDDGSSPDLVARFRRESSITARLDHPSIPPVYEAGSTPTGQPFLLMKVIEGEPLSKRIPAESDPRPLLEALVKVGEAIAYAHSQRVLHRDLKPENVMTGRFGEVLVMDWGLARELDKADVPLPGAGPPGGAAGLSQVGTVMGTPGYMPPEQAGGEEVDERADVFALGAILTEILTGEPPVTGSDALSRITRTIKGEIQSPRERRKDVAPELDAIARGALASERAARTPSAEAFVADLRAYLQGEPVSCYRYGPRERLLRAARRRPGLTIGLLALLVISVLLVGGLSQLRASEQALALSQKEREAADAAAELAAERERATKAQAAASEAKAEAAREAARAREEAAAERAKQSAREQAAVSALLEALRATQSGAAPDPAAIERALDDFRTEATLTLAARVYLSARDLERATTLLEEVARDHPPALGALRLLHEIEQHRSKTYEDDTKYSLEAERRAGSVKSKLAEHVRTIRKLKVLGQPGTPRPLRERAIAELTAIVREQPNFYEAILQRGFFLQALGRSEEAVADFQRAAKLSLLAWKPYYNLGSALHDLGRYREAVLAYDTCLARYPDNVHGLVARAFARAKLGNHRGSLADADAALALDPSSYDALTHRGIAKKSLGDYEGALEDQEQALKLRPGFPGAIANLANTYQAMGEKEEALKLYTQLCQRVPNDWRPWYSRGLAYSSLGRHAEAVQDHDRSIGFDRTSPIPLVARAGARLKLGDVAGARQDLDAAAALDPNYEWTAVVRGHICVEANDFEGALAAYGQALKQKPDLAEAEGRRGLALRALKRLPEAQKALKRALLLDPHAQGRFEFLRAAIEIEEELKGK